MKTNRIFLIVLLAMVLLASTACATVDTEEELEEVQTTVVIDEETTQSLTAQVEQSQGTEITLADGTYTGAADGYGDDLTVEVDIVSGMISEITIVSHNEHDERFYGTAMASVPDMIIEAQSVEVDSVSGATYTSVGIKNAVLNALEQAVVSGDLPEAEEAPSGGHHHH